MKIHDFKPGKWYRASITYSLHKAPEDTELVLAEMPELTFFMFVRSVEPQFIVSDADNAFPPYYMKWLHIGFQDVFGYICVDVELSNFYELTKELAEST